MARPINRMRPVHPGEVLREDFLAPLGLSVNALAVALGVPATRIHEIVKERRGVSAESAARLARYFGGKPATVGLGARRWPGTMSVGRLSITMHVRHRIGVRP